MEECDCVLVSPFEWAAAWEFVSVEKRRAFLKNIFDQVLELISTNLNLFDADQQPSSGDLLGTVAATKIAALSLLDATVPLSSMGGNDGYTSLISLVLKCLGNMTLIVQREVHRRLSKLHSLANLADFDYKNSFSRLPTTQNQLTVLVQLLSVAHAIAMESPGHLFSENKEKRGNLLALVTRLNTECFFGDQFGFQYEPSIGAFLRIVFLACASVGAAVPSESSASKDAARTKASAASLAVPSASPEPSCDAAAAGPDAQPRPSRPSAKSSPASCLVEMADMSNLASASASRSSSTSPPIMSLPVLNAVLNCSASPKHPVTPSNSSETVPVRQVDTQIEPAALSGRPSSSATTPPLPESHSAQYDQVPDTAGVSPGGSSSQAVSLYARGFVPLVSPPSTPSTSSHAATLVRRLSKSATLPARVPTTFSPLAEPPHTADCDQSAICDSTLPSITPSVTLPLLASDRMPEVAAAALVSGDVSRAERLQAEAEAPGPSLFSRFSSLLSRIPIESIPGAQYLRLPPDLAGEDMGAMFARVLDVVSRPLESIPGALPARTVSDAPVVDTGLDMVTVGQALFRGAVFHAFPAQAAAQFESIKATADIEFIRMFWNITELPVVKALARFPLPAVATLRSFRIPPTPFPVPVIDSEMELEIQPARRGCAANGNGSQQGALAVSVMLISNKTCPESASAVRPGSQYQFSTSLIIHMHGGGFVAQTSSSHEGYLRGWTKETNVPIVSIDYHLAPEYQYPVALDQCYFAYHWCIQNAFQLGSTAERVVLVGDSAGGNLALSLALRCIMEKTRAPDAVILAYPALYLSDAPSASRLLSVVDPLLPTSFLLKCLHSYVPDGLDPLSQCTLSPVVAPDELLLRLPAMYVMCGSLDPLLDDSVYLVRRLRALDKPVTFKVFHGFPHGFLNMGFAVPSAHRAVSVASSWLREALSAR